MPNLEISTVNPVAIKPGAGQYKPVQTHHLALNPHPLFQVSPVFLALKSIYKKKVLMSCPRPLHPEFRGLV